MASLMCGSGVHANSISVGPAAERGIVFVATPGRTGVDAWCAECMAVFAQEYTVSKVDLVPIACNEEAYSDYERAVNILKNAGTEKCLCSAYHAVCWPCEERQQDEYHGSDGFYAGATMGGG